MLERSVGTHDGSFHADEVCACAILFCFDLIDRDKIFRTRDSEVLQKCEYVCDVGGKYDPSIKRFDHHQLEYTGELSSAGMIWKYLRDKQIVDEALYEFLNRNMIIGVDAHDNGRVLQEEGVCTFSHIIANYAPIEYGAKEDKLRVAFDEALDFTVQLLKRYLSRFAYIASCRDIVKEQMKNLSKVLIFEKAIPWQENFFDLGGETHPALFLIMPTGAHWKLRGIPPNHEDKMGVRMPLPEKWAGLRNAELKKVTGIEGAIFCHKGRFIAIFETREDAVKAVRKVLKEEV